MSTSIKNILIGIFVLAAVGIMIFMLLFLHPSVGDNAKTLKVLFTDIDKVNIGTRVTFAGKPVGEVISIKEIPDARINRINEHGDVYVYELVLKVDSSVEVFNTDVISLRTSGLLGERNIEIDPQPLKEGQKLINVDNEILYAVQTISVEETMKQIWQLSEQFGTVLNDVHIILKDVRDKEIVEEVKSVVNKVKEISEKVDSSWNTVDAILENVYCLTDRAHRSWTTVDRTIDNFHELSQRAHRTLSSVDIVIDDFQTSAKNTIAFTETANEIIDYTKEGKGTLGQLLIGDDFALRLKSILHKGEVAINDVNTFGLLFHLDKRWQRLQGQRLKVLERLRSPHAFAKYFNDEMDQISSSISNVAVLLNESPSPCDSLISNPKFVQKFSELLKRIENMEETLKLFNEQAIDEEQPCR